MPLKSDNNNDNEASIRFYSILCVLYIYIYYPRVTNTIKGSFGLQFGVILKKKRQIWKLSFNLFYSLFLFLVNHNRIQLVQSIFFWSGIVFYFGFSEAYLSKILYRKESKIERIQAIIFIICCFFLFFILKRIYFVVSFCSQFFIDF